MTYSITFTERPQLWIWLFQMAEPDIAVPFHGFTHALFANSMPHPFQQFWCLLKDLTYFIVLFCGLFSSRHTFCVVCKIGWIRLLAPSEHSLPFLIHSLCPDTTSQSTDRNNFPTQRRPSMLQQTPFPPASLPLHSFTHSTESFILFRGRVADLATAELREISIPHTLCPIHTDTHKHCHLNLSPTCVPLGRIKPVCPWQ